MADESVNLFEYEQLLMGQRKNFTLSFKGNTNERKTEAGNIWRYAVKNILGWSPEAAVKYLDDEIVDKLLLNKTFTGIGFDREHTFVADYRFILQYAFPDEIRYDMYTETIAEYERFAKLGRWANDKSLYKHPKKFFTDADGIERAGICLRYAVGMFMGDVDIKDRYLFFGSAPQANKWLKKRGLNKPIALIFSSPLEYFHKTLPLKDRDEMLYNSLLLRNRISGIKIVPEEDGE